MLRVYMAVTFEKGAEEAEAFNLPCRYLQRFVGVLSQAHAGVSGVGQSTNGRIQRRLFKPMREQQESTSTCHL